MTTTISVFNNKGGVGKTSIIWNLATALADLDKNVLLYLMSNPHDTVIQSKGKPKFGGWIYNNFDTRMRNGVKNMVAADAVHHNSIKEEIELSLIPSLNSISTYDAVPTFVEYDYVAGIEDLNVMASDSLFQNIPVRYLSEHRPTTNLRGRGSWAQNQIDLMDEMYVEYDELAQYIDTNF